MSPRLVCRFRSSLWNLPNRPERVPSDFVAGEAKHGDLLDPSLPSVMFGALFRQGQEKSVASKEQAQEDHDRPDGHERRASEQPPPTLRPSLDRGVTTAVSTPHDTVLAELFSQKPAQAAGRPDPKMHEAALRMDEPETIRYRSRSPSRTALHDPFAGSLIGLSVQDEGDHVHNDRAGSGAKREDLWSHMANIREIQTQLASMHVGMENIGLGHRTKALSVERVHSTVPSEGEKWEDAVEGEDEEAKEKDAREQEFTKLANKFHGRKEATENIMSKVRITITTLFEHVLIKLPVARRAVAGGHGIPRPADTGRKLAIEQRGG